jgi:hypothetical protein
MVVSIVSMTDLYEVFFRKNSSSESNMVQKKVVDQFVEPTVTNKVCVSLAGHMCFIMGKENPQNYWFLGIKRDKIPQMECILLVCKMCPCCSSREAQVDLSDRPRFPPSPKFPPPPPQKGTASHSPHGVSKGERPLLGPGGHHVLARLSPDFCKVCDCADADLPLSDMLQM